MPAPSQADNEWKRQVTHLALENEVLRESEDSLKSKVAELEAQLFTLKAQAETTKRAVALLYDAAHADIEEAIQETEMPT